MQNRSPVSACPHAGLLLPAAGIAAAAAKEEGTMVAVPFEDITMGQQMNAAGEKLESFELEGISCSSRVRAAAVSAATVGVHSKLLLLLLLTLERKGFGKLEIGTRSSGCSAAPAAAAVVVVAAAAAKWLYCFTLRFGLCTPFSTLLANEVTKQSAHVNKKLRPNFMLRFIATVAALYRRSCKTFNESAVVQVHYEM